LLSPLGALLSHWAVTLLPTMYVVLLLPVGVLVIVMFGSDSQAALHSRCMLCVFAI